jgi:hypothetical protein
VLLFSFRYRISLIVHQILLSTRNKGPYEQLSTYGALYYLPGTESSIVIY